MITTTGSTDDSRLSASDARRATNLNRGGFRSALRLILAAALILSSAAEAQINRATVVGRVADASGAVIAGADVQFRRVSTNEVFRAETTTSGDYTIVNLPADGYEIQVTTEGFKTEVRTGIRLEIGSVSRFDFNMSVGSVTESVQVTGQAALLKTESPEMGQVVNSGTIAGLPLNSRDFLSLARMVPGVIPTRGSTGDGGRDSSGFSVEGRRRTDNIVYVDGSIMSDGNGNTTFFPNVDALQEFELKTGLYSAEFGIRPGGQFSTVTKSGTNQLHGTLFAFHRNDNLSARNFFDPAERPEYKRNQFGGVVSGPIILPGIFDGRDKAWFMFAASGERVRQFQSLRGYMPTVAEKQGRFATAIRDPLTGDPFPDNTIPASRMNPVAQRFLPLWPDPNAPGGSGYNFISPNSTNNPDQDQVLAKVDFNLSPVNRWSARFIWDRRPLIRSSAIQRFNVTDPLGTRGQNLTNTRTFGGKVMNDFGIHWFRRPYYPGLSISEGSEGFGRTLGIPNFPASPVDLDGVPSLNITGYFTLGDGSTFGAVPIGNWEVKDNVSFVRSSHSFKAGYHFRRNYNFFQLNSRSSFRFNRAYSGNNFADFLLGVPASAAIGAEGTRANLAQDGHYFYLQDDWKATARLTVNLGVRYEYRAPWKDKRGFASNTNPATAELFPPPQPLDLEFWETGRFTPNYPLVEWSNRTPLPRIGLAYRLTNRTVIRSGYGIYANEPIVGMVQLLGSNPRENAGQRNFISDLSRPTISLSDPFNLSQLSSGAGLPNLYGTQTPMPLSMIHMWNFTVQQSITGSTSVEAGYTGNSSVHELAVVSWNDAVPGTAPRQERRPFPEYQNINMVFANANSSYHGLELKLQQRPGPSGISALVAFTFAKSLDVAGGRLAVPGDPSVQSRNLMGRANRGRSEADNPGRFTAALGYQLPFGKGRPFLTSGIGNHLLGGWSFDTLFVIQSGPFITPANGADLLDTGSTASYRPDVFGDPNLPGSERSTERWFDTSVFRQAERLRYGNAGRSIIRAPGYTTWDLSAHREFALQERLRLELRFEGFNMANTGNLGFPGTTVGTPAFGKITSAQPARDLQLGMKLQF